MTEEALIHPWWSFQWFSSYTTVKVRKIRRVKKIILILSWTHTMLWSRPVKDGYTLLFI